MVKIKYQKYFFIIFILIVFSLPFNPSVDPDLGWHLKTGELILERGVPKTDWYSYTMPDYPWIDHEWLSDVISYFVFSKTGLLGLSFLFSLILTAVFLMVYSSLSDFLNKEIKIILTLLSILVSSKIIFFGARMQYITLAGITFLFYILLKWREGKIPAKKLYIIPLIFALWANLHGGFIIGIFVFASFILLEFLYFIFQEMGFEFFQERPAVPWKNIKKAAILIPFSVITTLINPYFHRIYVEIYKTFIDKETFNNISEWFSPNFHNPASFYFVIYFIIGVITLIFSKKKPDFTLGILSIFFLVMSFRSIRNVPIFVIIYTIFISYHLIFNFGIFKRRLHHWKAIFLFALIGVFLAVASFRIYNTITASFSKGMYSIEGGYPTLLIQYLREHPLSGNVFNSYNWGGYLIWDGVVDKVFVDGRMPHWEKDGRCAFCDYMAIGALKPGWKEKMNQYNIDWVLISKGSVLDGMLREMNNWEFYAADRYGVVYKRKK